jgi:hypothetical protein
MAAVTTMSVMHEHMHEEAGKERQPDEHTEDMRPVLGEQERAGDQGEANEYKSGA